MFDSDRWISQLPLSLLQSTNTNTSPMASRPRGLAASRPRGLAASKVICARTGGEKQITIHLRALSSQTVSCLPCSLFTLGFHGTKNDTTHFAGHSLQSLNSIKFYLLFLCLFRSTTGRVHLRYTSRSSKIVACDGKHGDSTKAKAVNTVSLLTLSRTKLCVWCTFR